MIIQTAPDKRSLRAALRHLGYSPFVWLYLGDSLDRLRSVEQEMALRKGKKLAIGENVERVAERLRDAYIDYIGQLSLRRHGPRWWRSRFAEKNPYYSQTFFHSCCVTACAELLPGLVEKTSVLLVVENESLREALRLNVIAPFFGIVIADSPTRRVLRLLGKFSEVVLRQAYYGAINLGRVVCARYWFRLHKTPSVQQVIYAKRPICVVHTWVDQRAYDPVSGEFRNDDYAGVVDYLERRRGKTVFLLPDVLYSASYRRVAGFVSRAGNFLVPHAFLRVRDLLAALVAAGLSFPRRTDYPRFAGLDISGLIKHDFWNEWIQQSVLTSLLVEKWVRRCQEAGLQIERFIYTYECFAWERMLCLAFREHYPETRLIAHQPSGLPRLCLNVFIAQAERDLVPLPDIIVTNGRHAAALLRSSGYDGSRIREGGGLRQRYLQQRLNGARAAPSVDARPRVLVAPSGSRKAGIQLLQKVVHAFTSAPDLDVVLKCHPNVPFSWIGPRLDSRDLPRHFQVSQGRPLRKLLEEADVLIYNDQTYLGVEALAAGVPVIYVQADFGLDLDCLGAFPDARMIARSPADIQSCVQKILEDRATSKRRSRETKRRVIPELIGTVSEDTYALFAS